MLQKRSKPSGEQGFSLIEVMLAMLLLAVGGSGLALVLLASVQGTAQAQERSMVTLQASELAQLIHANPSTLGHFIYAATQPANCGDGLPCPTIDWASSHLHQWQQALERSASRAQGLVCMDSSPLDGEPGELACDGTGEALVKIVWQEQVRGQRTLETKRLVMPLPRP
ncbi:MAG: type IV pilus modification protein PilV [Xanthomonadales bacterium]|nr:type IV pilus modification protein PilV [Xanthomonadales bacterium]